MGKLFTEIIFPPKPKPIVDHSKEDLHFDYWIVGTAQDKALYIQCPVCFFGVRVATVLDEKAIVEYIERFPAIYFNAAIRECPERDQHGSQPWHQHLQK